MRLKTALNSLVRFNSFVLGNLFLKKCEGEYVVIEEISPQKGGSPVKWTVEGLNLRTKLTMKKSIRHSIQKFLKNHYLQYTCKTTEPTGYPRIQLKAQRNTTQLPHLRFQFSRHEQGSPCRMKMGYPSCCRSRYTSRFLGTETRVRI